MDNQFLKKLRIKPSFTVSIINAPENAMTIFGDIPDTITFHDQWQKHSDAYLIFAITKAEMLTALAEITPAINRQTIAWIFYPKAKTALAADLNLMQSWEDLTKYNLVPCGSVAVDDIWTGIRITSASSQKKSGVGNAEIANNAYGQYIDVASKIITLPEDLKNVLTEHPDALAYYEQLAYSHRKEYVLWILSAKQEKTRTERITKMVQKLLEKKKNPSAK